MAVEEDRREEAELPVAYALEQNYPNTFNPSTTIRYALPEATHVRLEIFDVLGQRVAMLVDRVQGAGRYEVNFVAGDLPSGVYFYQLEAGAFRRARQLLLVK